MWDLIAIAGDVTTPPVAGLRRIVGLLYVEEGRAHILPSPCLFVANRQSAWKMLAFLVSVSGAAIVAKRELLAIPWFGWFLRRSPMIVIDRADGTQALRTIIGGAREAVAAGRSVLAHEGKRGAIGAPVRFKRGAKLFYGRLGPRLLRKRGRDRLPAQRVRRMPI